MRFPQSLPTIIYTKNVEYRTTAPGVRPPSLSAICMERRNDNSPAARSLDHQHHPSLVMDGSISAPAAAAFLRHKEEMMERAD